MLRKILLTLLTIVVVAIAGIAIYVASRQNLVFDAPYPNIAASTDSAVVARGRYLVRDVVNCASCHGDTTRMAAMRETGEDIPLSGGYHWDIPPGTIYARNITSDPETGIGSFPDSTVARALRHGVGHDGRALLPFMELQGLADDDLAAVISYLRTQPPVPNAIPAHRFTLLGKVVKATVLANPVSAAETPPVRSPRGATVENGRYLAEHVALCWSCHTERDMATGGLVGPRYGGAKVFDEPSDPGHIWAPPNITSDPTTGRLAAMTEDEFVTRFRAGRLLPGSPMPWQGFSRMAEDDLRAIYRFLKTVPPAVNDVGPPVTEKKKS